MASQGSSVFSVTCWAALVGAALLGAPVAANGQDSTAAARGLGASDHRNVFSINPLAIPLEYISAEYERVTSRFATLGLAASYLGAFDDRSYSTVEGKVRFYFNEEAPKGFSVGLGAGVTRIAGKDSRSDEISFTRPTVLVIADYNWLLGKGDRFMVGGGVGTKRVLGEDNADFGEVYPTLRFQIGVRY